MNKFFQAFLAFFSGTGTKLVAKNDGTDVTPEQLEQLGKSEQFATFVAEAQGARIDELTAQLQTQTEANTGQMSAMQQKLAALEQTLAQVVAANAELKAQVQAAADSAAAANAQADEVAKAINFKRSASPVQKEPLQTANEMLRSGSHANTKEPKEKLNINDALAGLRLS